MTVRENNAARETAPATDAGRYRWTRLCVILAR
jgi:hypothetical protein